MSLSVVKLGKFKELEFISMNYWVTNNAAVKLELLSSKQGR